MRKSLLNEATGILAGILIGWLVCMCGLVFGADADAQVRLDWEASKAADFGHYTVYRDSGEFWARLAPFGPTTVTIEMDSVGPTRLLRPAGSDLATTFTAVAWLQEPWSDLKGMDEATTFTFFVTASDRVGNESVPSALAWAMTADRTAPGAIESLRIVEASVTTETVTVRFDVRVGLRQE